MTELRLYNTLTRTKEVFRPIDPTNVRMYVCGPTVYDYAHIGNARPAIVFDVLYRLLRHVYGAEHVTYVRNITDVDDKINARALRDYGAEIEAGRLSLNEAIRKVTEPTYDQYQKDVTALGCLPPTHQPRATEFVLPRGDGRADMVSLIQSLIDRGHAYEAQGEILFDTASMPDYGQLSKRNLDEQQAGARVAVDAHKKNPQDFVLWKQSSDAEPGWDAAFALAGGARAAIRGRPGWHIECSAMSDALLWDAVKDRLSAEARERPHQFDIHGGGLDLIFPHHENEIAQSRCAHGTAVMANYWMHNGFLQVEGRKMSKSDGNFVTIRDNLRGVFPGWKGGAWHGLVLRCAMLMTHYRQPIDWKLDRLLEARARIWRFYLFVSNWRDDNWQVVQREGLEKTASSPFDEVVDALSDDLNTPAALKFLSEVIERPGFLQEVPRLISSLGLLGLLNDRALSANPVVTSEVSRGGSNIDAPLVATELGVAIANNDSELADVLRARLHASGWTAGLLSPNHIDLKLIDPKSKFNVEEAVSRRLSLIAAKNWPEADRIRDELLAQGIQLKDGKDPATGERITTWEIRR